MFRSIAILGKDVAISQVDQVGSSSFTSVEPTGAVKAACDPTDVPSRQYPLDVC